MCRVIYVTLIAVALMKDLFGDPPPFPTVPRTPDAQRFAELFEEDPATISKNHIETLLSLTGDTRPVFMTWSAPIPQPVIGDYATDKLLLLRKFGKISNDLACHPMSDSEIDLGRFCRLLRLVNYSEIGHGPAHILVSTCKSKDIEFSFGLFRSMESWKAGIGSGSVLDDYIDLSLKSTNRELAAAAAAVIPAYSDRVSKWNEALIGGCHELGRVGVAHAPDSIEMVDSRRLYLRALVHNGEENDQLRVLLDALSRDRDEIVRLYANAALWGVFKDSESLKFIIEAICDANHKIYVREEAALIINRDVAVSMEFSNRLAMMVIATQNGGLVATRVCGAIVKCFRPEDFPPAVLHAFEAHSNNHVRQSFAKWIGGR